MEAAQLCEYTKTTERYTLKGSVKFFSQTKRNQNRIYLSDLALLGLCCYAQASLAVESRGSSLVELASLAVEHRLQNRGPAVVGMC